MTDEEGRNKLEALYYWFQDSGISAQDSVDIAISYLSSLYAGNLKIDPAKVFSLMDAHMNEFLKELLTIKND